MTRRRSRAEPPEPFDPLAPFPGASDIEAFDAAFAAMLDDAGSGRWQAEFEAMLAQPLAPLDLDALAEFERLMRAAPVFIGG